MFDYQFDQAKERKEAGSSKYWVLNWGRKRTGGEMTSRYAGTKGGWSGTGTGRTYARSGTGMTGGGKAADPVPAHAAAFPRQDDAGYAWCRGLRPGSSFATY